MRRSLMRSGIALSLCLIAGIAQATCTPDLSHLSSALPAYANPELLHLRDQLLATNVQQTLRETEGRGLSADAASDEQIGYLLGLEDGQAQAEQCVRRSTARADAVLRSLDAGTYVFGASGEVSDACAASYVRYRYARVATQELARNMTCVAEAW